MRFTPNATKIKQNLITRKRKGKLKGLEGSGREGKGRKGKEKGRGRRTRVGNRREGEEKGRGKAEKDGK